MKISEAKNIFDATETLRRVESRHPVETTVTPAAFHMTGYGGDLSLSIAMSAPTGVGFLATPNVVGWGFGLGITPLVYLRRDLRRYSNAIPDEFVGLPESDASLIALPTPVLCTSLIEFGGQIIWRMTISDDRVNKIVDFVLVPYIHATLEDILLGDYEIAKMLDPYDRAFPD